VTKVLKVISLKSKHSVFASINDSDHLEDVYDIICLTRFDFMLDYSLR
jgi:hypothetical protein